MCRRLGISLQCCACALHICGCGEAAATSHASAASAPEFSECKLLLCLCLVYTRTVHLPSTICEAMLCFGPATSVLMQCPEVCQRHLS